MERPVPKEGKGRIGGRRGPADQRNPRGEAHPRSFDATGIYLRYASIALKEIWTTNFTNSTNPILRIRAHSFPFAFKFSPHPRPSAGAKRIGGHLREEIWTTNFHEFHESHLPNSHPFAFHPFPIRVEIHSPSAPSGGSEAHLRPSALKFHRP